jgi:hypothetical protein
MLKGVLKDHEFNPSNEIEEATTKVWNELTFDEVQSLVHNWMSCFTWAIEDRGEHIIESTRNGFLACSESENQKGPGTFLTPCTSRNGQRSVRSIGSILRCRAEASTAPGSGNGSNY